MPPGAKPTMMVIGLLEKSSARAAHGMHDSRTARVTACRTILHIVPSQKRERRRDRRRSDSSVETLARKSGRGARRVLRWMEAGADRVLLAHIGALPGLAVIPAVAEVVHHGPWIGPDHGVGRAIGLRLGLGR